ncbi:MAG: Spy/CpxP family protein refolding chaperone [Rhizomicrobium sp.]
MTLTSSATARLALASSLAVCFLAVAGPALAADFGQTARPSPPSICAMPAGHGYGAVAARHVKHLHDQLKITPDQEAQWSGVAQVMLDNAAAMDGAMRDRARSAATMTAVDDLNSYQANRRGTCRWPQEAGSGVRAALCGDADGAAKNRRCRVRPSHGFQAARARIRRAAQRSDVAERRVHALS